MYYRHYISKEIISITTSHLLES